MLLINIRCLGSEIAKNILLSGINSLTILDDGVVTEEELNKNFLLSRDSIGKKVRQECKFINLFPDFYNLKTGFLDILSLITFLSLK